MVALWVEVSEPLTAPLTAHRESPGSEGRLNRDCSPADRQEIRLHPGRQQLDLDQPPLREIAHQITHPEGPRLGLMGKGNAVR